MSLRQMRCRLGIPAALLLLASCGGGGQSTTEVRPFSEIQASEFAFEVDPLDPGRAIFRVETTEPAICAIVWGETESLGRFNNSLAMNGTGIVQHDVFLPGAVPGATYFFRVQGSTADGTLYQSELATFTVPAADDSGDVGAGTDHGQNLALAGSIAEVSSEFSAAWGAGNAIDGDLTTEWSTAGDGGDASITIDLGAARQIRGVEFVTRSMADGSAITTSYTVSVDGGDPLGPFSAGSPAEDGFQPIEADGRLVRFEAADTTGGNTGAIEIRIFGP